MIISSKKHPLQNLDKLPDAKRSELGSGLQANVNTIEIMSKMARDYSGHPLVVTLTRNILDYCKIPSHHHLDEARAIGAFVQKHIRYAKDIAGVETLHAPDMIINSMRDRGYFMADCDDMALLTATMLMSVGIRPFYRAVRYSTDSGPYNHIYVVVYESNTSDSLRPGKPQRLVIDCIVKDKPIGFEIPHKSGKEFEV